MMQRPPELRHRRDRATFTPGPALPSARGRSRQVCAAVNALAVQGDSGADAIATAASAYQITQAQVVAAIGERCPELKKIIPAGA